MSGEELEKIYTAEEAAAHLKLTKRAVMKLGRKYGCSILGRHFRFTQQDLDRILQATRPEPRADAANIKSEPRRFVQRSLTEVLASRHPPIIHDARVTEVLRAIGAATRPVTAGQIERCGERTLDILIDKGVVAETGRTSTSLRIVAITEKGRARIKKLDEWYERFAPAEEARRGRPFRRR